MKVFEVTDHTNSKSIHLSVNKEAAIQAHLYHYGLLGLDKEPQVNDGIPLEDWKKKRDTICWDSVCVLIASSILNEALEMNKRGRPRIIPSD